MNVHSGALHLVANTLSNAIRPVVPLPFIEWLPKNIILVDGPRKGEAWSLHDAPYLGEIAKALDLDDPCNLVTVRKSQQTGVSILALAWCLYIADLHADNILYGVPGIDALQEMNGKKLQPMIDAWHRSTGKRIILPSVSRSGMGSTIYEKRFAGGSLSLANANSVMDLSAKTSRFGVKDEVSKWNNTPNGDDPEELFFGRFTSFRRQKLYKIFELSTPELDSGEELGEGPGHCRVDRSFRRSDQRFYNIQCPECLGWLVQSHEGFAINRNSPHKSYYECAACGHHISEMERVPAVRAGHFVASAPGGGRHPGFHVDAFISLMMSYGDIADDWLRAEGKGEAGSKAFSNLVLALPYAMKGNAPDWKRLMERREELSQGIIPAEGLLFVAGADVQHDGIYLEVVAFAEDRQSWVVEALFLEGATDNPNAGAWERLDEQYWRSFADVYGNERRFEALGVDAGDGARTNQVYEWCRRRPNTYATKGMHGRGVPAIGTPSKRSVNKRGKRVRVRGAQSWPIGTWALKAEFMGNLHKIGLAAGEVVDPGGYCHFGKWLGEEYFRQITAEYFAQKMVRGKLHEEWMPIRRDNHFLDCRIIAMSLAEFLGLSKMTPGNWAVLREKYQPTEADLLSPQSQKIVTISPEKSPKSQTSNGSMKEWLKKK